MAWVPLESNPEVIIYNKTILISIYLREYLASFFASRVWIEVLNIKQPVFGLFFTYIPMNHE